MWIAVSHPARAAVNLDHVAVVRCELRSDGQFAVFLAPDRERMGETPWEAWSGFVQSHALLAREPP